MNDQELLKAIRQIVKEEIDPVKKDVSTLQAGQLKIQILLENEIDRKLSALFEGHQLDSQKIDHINETVDDIDASLTAVDVVTHANTKEINRLKSRLG